ncbi:MAG: hypothetical protein BGO66_00675 [Alicycliphilus sp. 69-12]|nr:MAG: hypothetical protein BGO66_00675 [Alicycliphilus sp. 69-12]
MFPGLAVQVRVFSITTSVRMRWPPSTRRVCSLAVRCGCVVPVALFLKGRTTVYSLATVPDRRWPVLLAICLTRSAWGCATKVVMLPLASYT